MKNFANTTTRKVLFVLYGTLLLTSVALIAWLHSGQLKSLKHEALGRLGGVTGTMAVQLDGSRIVRLLKTYDSAGMLVSNTQDPYYYVIHGSLKKCAEANGITDDLVIVSFDANKRELQTVVTSNREPSLRAAYLLSGATEIIAYLASSRVDGLRLELPDDLVSIDAVRDARGTVTGAIVARADMRTLVATANGRLWRNIGFAAVALVVIAIFLFRSVGRLVQREEDARNNWQQRHAGITDSIAYAGKIQGALIPKPEALREQFDRWFVLNKPKDTVSGDFHWYHRLGDDTCLVALADCTGHGLPGAMMAAIGCSLLNEVVSQSRTKDPAEMLAALNRSFVQALNQHGQRKGAGDGMDIALCRIDRKEREILFAGAYRPLYWIHDGQLTVINGDRKPIGGAHQEPGRTYTTHRVAYHPHDRIYMFSDGYVDQFGGPERKKLMTQRFNALLMEGQQLPLDEQGLSLERAFNAWKGSEEQLDDVCVLGLEV